MDNYSFAASHRDLQRHQSYADDDYQTLLTWMEDTIRNYRAMPRRADSWQVSGDFNTNDGCENAPSYTRDFPEDGYDRNGSRRFERFRIWPNRANSFRQDGILPLHNIQVQQPLPSEQGYTIFTQIWPLTFPWNLGRGNEQTESLPKLPPSTAREVSEPGRIPSKFRCS